MPDCFSGMIRRTGFISKLRCSWPRDVHCVTHETLRKSFFFFFHQKTISHRLKLMAGCSLAVSRCLNNEMYNPEGCPELYQLTEPIHISILANPQQSPGKQARQVLSPVLWLKKQAWSFSYHLSSCSWRLVQLGLFPPASILCLHP